MKTKNKIVAAAGAVVFVTVALIACSAADQSEEESKMAQRDNPAGGTAPVSLEGPTWVLVSYGNPADPTPVIAGQAVTVTFDASAGGLGGNATCNRYFAGYRIDGNRLEIAEAGVTQMACPDPESTAQEGAYLAAIAAAGTFAIEANTLRISYGDGNVLTFREQPATPLEDTAWVVTGYNNGKGGVVSVIIGTKLTARFAGGELAGNAGCNSYHAGYQVEASGLRIGPAAATKKMCGRPEGIMAQEAQFLAALSSASVYRIDGDTLELRRAEGALAVKLKAETE